MTLRSLRIVGAVSLLAALAGCNVYTGAVRSEFVQEERMDERILRDEIAIDAPGVPSPSAPRLEIKISWNFQQEYRIRKFYRQYREFLPYDPVTEVLEVLSSPFLFLTALPAGIVMAPFELIASALGVEPAAAVRDTTEATPGMENAGQDLESPSPEALDKFLFWKLATLPFLFLNPAGNSDSWGLETNVYGKTPEYERLADLKELVDTPPPEEWTRAAGGAGVTVTIVETGDRVSLSADDKGLAAFPITEQRAQISQEGKGLTLRVEAAFQGKKAVRQFLVSPETLETIYETLRSE
jgi:hypothetical protein